MKLGPSCHASVKFALFHVLEEAQLTIELDGLAIVLRTAKVKTVSIFNREVEASKEANETEHV